MISHPTAAELLEDIGIRGRRCPATIKEIQIVAEDTYAVTFTPQGGRIAYVPGQYAWIILPELRYIDERGNRRAFSLCSVPDAPEDLMIVFRKSDTGFKKTLLELEIGTRIHIEGPLGSFVLPEEKTQKVALVAGGVGITPFMSMIQANTETHPMRPMVLFYANQKKERMVFHKELEAIQTNHPEIAVVFVDGMITDETLAPHLAAWKDAVWYLSGPQPMVIGMNTLLTQSGIPQEQILSEEFYAPAGLFADIADDRLRAVMEEQGRIFRLAVEQSPMHVVFTDVNGRILYANYNAERITGYTYKEMIGQTPRLWGGMMSKDLYHKLWETIKGKRQEYDGEFWNRRKNGEVYLAHGKIAPIQDEQGNLIGFVATEEDITDERRLEEESARLSAIVASSGDAIVAKTLQGTINAWNQGAERLYGYTAEEAIGQDAQLIVPEENRAEYIRMVNEARTGKIISQVKTVRRRKDGSLIDISLTYSPIYKDGVVIGISAIGHDITKEQTLARKESEFISIASHQLRTPMTGIRWVIERLAKKEHLSEKGKEYVADIEASIKTLSGLVETLLNTSRIDARTVGTAPEIVNVSQFIKGYCTECQPLAEGKKITFSFTDETDPSGTIATTDPLALRNIIQSLVSNAIEYTPEAGTVEVTLQNIERGFRIVVKDSGIGIPLKDRSLIFSKFGRASNASVVKPGGTGLGLYITQNAVTLLGGTIRFESEEGKGTAFIVELPLVSNPITGPKRMV